MHNIATIILAGGEGRRMSNQDKGLIYLANKPLISHVLVNLSTQTSLIFIVANRNLSSYEALINQHLSQYKHQEIQLIQDMYNYKGLGPLAGIASVIEKLPDDIEAVQLSSCDTPFLPKDIITQLAQARIQTQKLCSIPTTSNHLHYCHAQISHNLLGNVYDLLAKQHYHLRDFVNMQAQAVELNFTNEMAFLNCNTPASLALAEQWLINKRK